MAEYRDRVDAGRRLAEELKRFRAAQPIVLGLPRGGVPVAAEVARVLEAPLDIIVVRKLGVPLQPEFGMGAIAEHGARVINPEIIDAVSVTPEQLGAVERSERTKLEDRIIELRANRPEVDLGGRLALIVDDGFATGASARAACLAARARGADRVVVAAPVAPPEVRSEIIEADEVICPLRPLEFMAVGQFYDDFTQTTDDDVLALLAQAAQREHHRRQQHPPEGPGAAGE